MLCGRKACPCKAMHLDHNLVLLDSVAKRAAEKVQLPENIIKLEKSVDELIDGFIKSLDKAKSDHRQYMKEYMEKQVGGNVLRKRLTNNEELDRE